MRGLPEEDAQRDDQGDEPHAGVGEEHADQRDRRAPNPDVALLARAAVEQLRQQEGQSEDEVRRQQHGIAERRRHSRRVVHPELVVETDLEETDQAYRDRR